VAFLVLRREQSATLPERCFYGLALAFGVLYLAVQPPRASCAEWQHLLRARELSTGTLITRTDAAGPYYQAPSAFAGQLAQESVEDDPDRRVDPAKALTELFSREGMHDSVRIAAQPNLRSPLAYAVQVPAIALARLLDLSALGHLYLARLFGLVASVLIFGRAFALLPQLSWLFLALGLSPAVLMQAASSSPEGLALSLSCWFSALVARGSLRSQPSWPGSERTLALTLFALLIACRLTFAPFALCLLALPAGESDARRLLLKRALLVFGAVTALNLYLSRHCLAFMLEEQVLPQLSWVLRHPHRALWAWVRTAFKQIDDFMLELHSGSGVVSRDLRFLGGIVATLEAQLLALLALGRFRLPLSLAAQRKRAARIFLAMAVAYVGMTFAAAQIGHNLRAQAPLSGLDGAAFIPLLPPLLFALATAGRPLATRWLLHRGGYRVLVTLSLVNLLCALALVGRYYAQVEPPWPY
jgi:Predicted membrane protein (DUF2142)